MSSHSTSLGTSKDVTVPAQLELCANGLLSSSLQQMFYEWIRLRNHENLSGAENFVKMSLGNQRGKYFLVELEQQRCRYPSFIPVTFLFISLYILRIYAEHLMDFSELCIPFYFLKFLLKFKILESVIFLKFLKNSFKIFTVF